MKYPIHKLFFLFTLSSFINALAFSQKISLTFPKDEYTTETKTVNTSKGTIEVTYHSYMHIPYVSKPVDKDYQSLNVSVPVKINNKEIDAENAPILFKIGVGGYMSVNNAKTVSGESSRFDKREDLALASGLVVVSPGCRGRDNVYNDGTFYGKAPAAIVDLKAAVRYIRQNKGVIPGDVEKIISVGCSAGGAISALLGASGDYPLYETYLKEIGAANTSDKIFASACYSPITDLEHSDMAYEWMYGKMPVSTGLVDQKLSTQLINEYADYQKSLNLRGQNNYGPLTAENYKEYLLEYFLIPSANKYLKELPDEERTKYLSGNTWIIWNNGASDFNFENYVKHVGRMKGLPAFDDFNKKQPEPILFGDKTTNARHFTNFSLRHSNKNPNAEVGNEIKTLVNLMNAMYFIQQKNKGCAEYWWLRNGTSDNHTSQTVMINLATSLENQNKNVNTWLFWDGGHCADYDPEGLIKWINKITK